MICSLLVTFFFFFSKNQCKVVIRFFSSKPHLDEAWASFFLLNEKWVTSTIGSSTKLATLIKNSRLFIYFFLLGVLLWKSRRLDVAHNRSRFGLKLILINNHCCSFAVVFINTLVLSWIVLHIDLPQSQQAVTQRISLLFLFFVNN